MKKNVPNRHISYPEKKIIQKMSIFWQKEETSKAKPDLVNSTNPTIIYTKIHLQYLHIGQFEFIDKYCRQRWHR